MNVQNLNKLVRYLKKEPRRFDMGGWCNWADPSLPENPPCGAVACLAGNACIVSGAAVKVADGCFDPPAGGWFLNARVWLGLTKDQAERLFYLKTVHFSVKDQCRKERWHPWWPIRFERRYLAADSPKERVRVTAERVKHFIRTKGRF